ncbi:Carboxylate-amine ligase YbdK [Aquisphaera giovannonii]|uniref:Putative glutamate--cysteine ligase 2 n=1 Tax=Aquisphaera giovannonii TaxID=406548 RepID=A0A5B9WFH6_9BACT|nr:YbdK family carboxylate-amine ligase [Aquisphaera giovannonii]QEH39019.1 Carboxylate-amine ligase YbdK [Aquisphaera giovannonii]
MLAQGFQGSPAPTLGVEIELQLVDAGTLELRGVEVQALAEGLPPGIAGSVRREFHACCVEVATGICRDVDEVRRDLKEKLRWVAGAAAARGLMLAWAGTHPFSHWKGQAVTDDPRYRALAESYRETLLRQLTFGLHVHVGVGSGDAAIRACDRIREFLPVLLALSANSPFWCGRATGLQSHRMEVMGSLPAAGIPPYLGTWDAFEALVGHLTASGLIGSAKDLWWDVRPSPSHGTVEVRICDMPLGLDAVLGLTALIQCLVHTLARGGSCRGDGEARPGGEDEIRRARDLEHLTAATLQQDRWLAARHGLDAMLVNPRTAERTGARALARELIDGLMPVAEELGGAEHLTRLRAKTRGANGATAQLNAFARTGSLLEVVRLTARADSSGHWHPSLSPLLGVQGLLDHTGASL